MEINTELLKKLEYTLDTIHPEKGKVPINILGYGEISIVFDIIDDVSSIAYKRLPIFENIKQIKRHKKAFIMYNDILRRLGVTVPPSDVIWMKSSKRDGYTLYCAQEKVDSESFGHKILSHNVTEEEIQLLILLIMREMYKIWGFNERSKSIKVGLDGQISNWAVIGYDCNNPQISASARLIYLDTSTPLFRVNGVEAMEAVLFLKSAPSFLRWILKALFLEEVVGRYYDFRLVTIDLIANFLKEQHPKLIPGVLKIINDFFTEEVAELGITPIKYEEIKKYYDDDKQIWVIFQNARRLDRWIQTKLLRKHYDFYLPEKIER